MIHREQLVRKYNPILREARPESPFTVGNGNLAFTADVTGLQTFYEEYADWCPLLTMACDIWHSSEFEGRGRAYITPTEFKTASRRLKYPLTYISGEEKAYDYLRQNPHRFNLMRLGFVMNGSAVRADSVTAVFQELDLYTGILKSRFKLEGKDVFVETLAGDDGLAVKVDSVLLKQGLAIEAVFPYPSPNKNGGIFDADDRHITSIEEITVRKGMSSATIRRRADADNHYIRIGGNVYLEKAGAHRMLISVSGKNAVSISVCFSFSQKKEDLADFAYKQAYSQSESRMYMFWNRGGIVDVSRSADPRASELERRIILSMYLTFIQCTGDLPPQETGLTCNSWYGKFHLEMHPIHAAYLALYGRGDLLERSLSYYNDILEAARNIAHDNGFKGARWPKMTDPFGNQSPSIIAPLLLWQQPHVIYMLELLRLARYSEKRIEVPTVTEREFLEKYRAIIYETAEFMADYPEFDIAGNRYVLSPPLYSMQEKGNPAEILNPPFELAYWKFGLKTAASLLRRLGESGERYIEVVDKLSGYYVHDGLIAAYEGCSDTYERLNMDHPSMLFAPGFLGEDYDKDILSVSFDRMNETWDPDSLWGWDFAFLAMTLFAMGRGDEAFDMLLRDTPKNTYGINGNNMQGKRKDLPLYLPGNGSLLLAMSMLSSTENWYVEKEGMLDYPFRVQIGPVSSPLDERL